MIRPSVRLFTESTEVVPFDRKSPKMVVKYMKFRHDGIQKRRTISPFRDLLADTRKHAAMALNESHGLPQRLSKRLSDLGMFSRNYAEELVRSGVFFVDNKRVTDPSVIVGQDSALSLHFHKNTPLLLPNNLKLWLYHKPPGCTLTKEPYDVLCGNKE